MINAKYFLYVTYVLKIAPFWLFFFNTKLQTIALGVGVEIKFLAQNTLLHKAFIKVLT